MTERQLQKQKSHKTILKTAAKLFRKKGFAATGVDQVMAAAGLTAGGFYAHFKSKDELLVAVLAESLRDGFSRLSEGLEDLKGTEKVQMIFARYLSREHRDHPELGCPLPAIAAEIHRQGKSSLQVVQAYVQALTDTLVSELQEIPAAQREAMALHLVSTAIGGLLLARMCKGSKLSDLVLKSNKAQSANLLQTHLRGIS